MTRLISIVLIVSLLSCFVGSAYAFGDPESAFVLIKEPQTGQEGLYSAVSCLLLVAGMGTMASGWNHGEIVPFCVGAGCSAVGIAGLSITVKW